MSDNTALPMRIAAGRWVRHTFVRDNLVSALRTFAWLGPLTLLIWVYAERAQVVEVENVAFPIDVRSEDPNRFVMLDPSFQGSVVGKLNGPRSRIEAVRQDIRPNGNNEASVIINIDSRVNTGTVTFDGVTEVNQSEPFRYSGVNVSELRPSQIKVFVDNYEDREVEVKVPASVTNLVSAPTFTPARVKVRAPASYFRDVGTVTVEADFASARVLDRPGKRDQIPLRVYSTQLASYSGVTYSPQSVTATLEVGERNSSFTFDALPVYLVIAPGEIRDPQLYKITHPPAIQSVKVSGPPDKIALIERGEVKPPPRANVLVTGEDAPGADAGVRTVSKPVFIHPLPEGVVADAIADLEIKIERVAQ